MDKKKNDTRNKYYTLERNNGLHLTEIGYFRIINGVLRRTKGFDDICNEQGIIIKPECVLWNTFNYTFSFPHLDYLKKNYNNSINMKIQIIKSAVI